jgi:hypothetical protein
MTTLRLAFLCTLTLVACGGVPMAQVDPLPDAALTGPALDFATLPGDAATSTPVGDASTTPAEDGSTTSPSKDMASSAPAAGTFSGNVKPMLTSYACFDCHMSTPWDAGSSLSAAKLITHLTGTKSSDCPSLPFVTPGNAANSYLYQVIVGSGSCFTGESMPPGESVSSADVAALKSWIEAGALNN